MGDESILNEIISSDHMYKYSNYINTPKDMGMSGKGSLSALENNLGGLIAYVSILTTTTAISIKFIIKCFC